MCFFFPGHGLTFILSHTLQWDRLSCGTFSIFRICPSFAPCRTPKNLSYCDHAALTRSLTPLWAPPPTDTKRSSNIWSLKVFATVHQRPPNRLFSDQFCVCDSLDVQPQAILSNFPSADVIFQFLSSWRNNELVSRLRMTNSREKLLDAIHPLLWCKHYCKLSGCIHHCYEKQLRVNQALMRSGFARIMLNRTWLFASR